MFSVTTLERMAIQMRRIHSTLTNTTTRVRYSAVSARRGHRRLRALTDRP